MDTFLFCFFVTAITIVGYYVYVVNKRKPRRNPPGPPSYPIIGSLGSMDLVNGTKSHFELAKKHGPIYKVDVGSYPMVMLNDPEIIREAFSREEFVARPRYWTTMERTRVNGGGPGEDGIVFAEGETWKEHRRFILQSFRDFGVGKFKMEEKAIEEAVMLAQFLEQQNGQPIDARIPLSTAVANVIASVLTGARYDMNDPEFKAFLDHCQETFKYTWQKLLIGVMPSLRFFPLQGAYAKLIATFEGLQGFFRKSRDSHLESWEPERNADFLEHYISAVKSGSHKTFSLTHIPLLLEDLFEAGFETTSTTLRWAFLLLSLNPDVQARVQKELDENVPQGEIPTPSAKHRLPYTEATVMEVHRYGSIVPFGVTHRAVVDTTLGSYFIAKDSWIAPNIYYCHHNEQWWESPEKFDPTRFLTENLEIKQSDYLIPFSLGKRRCPGEGLAKMEVFIFFAAILQRFTIRFPNEIQEVNLRPMPGVTSDTSPHKLCFLPRTAS